MESLSLALYQISAHKTSYPVCESMSWRDLREFGACSSRLDTGVFIFKVMRQLKVPHIGKRVPRCVMVDLESGLKARGCGRKIVT